MKTVPRPAPRADNPTSHLVRDIEADFAAGRLPAAARLHSCAVLPVAGEDVDAWLDGLLPGLGLGRPAPLACGTDQQTTQGGNNPSSSGDAASGPSALVVLLHLGVDYRVGMVVLGVGVSCTPPLQQLGHF